MNVVPWNRQVGAGPFRVIFDGRIWVNAWRVECRHCPGGAATDPDNNPWRDIRPATPEELEIGNPTSCPEA